MKKRIPSALGIAIVVLAAIAAIKIMFYAAEPMYALSEETNIVPSIPRVAKKNTCESRAFTGKESLQVWYDEKTDDGMIVCNLVESEFSKLPLYENSDSFKEKNKKIIIANASEEEISRIERSSAEQPEEVDVQGFLHRCNGLSVAVANYQEGDFKKFLDI